jgi:PAS domain S-box-containing protein
MQTCILVIGFECDEVKLFTKVVQEKFESLRVAAKENLRQIEIEANCGEPLCIFINNSRLNGHSIDLIRELQKNFITREIPVVIVTDPVIGDCYRREALDAGVSAFLNKPVNDAELAEFLLSLPVRKHSAQRGSKNGGNNDDEIAETRMILSERLKELECLHAIGRLVVAPGLTTEEVLEKSANIIASSMQFPKQASVTISVDDNDFVSGNSTDHGLMISCGICINDELSGLLAVGYPDGKAEGAGFIFLPQEKDLIKTVAGTLGRYLEYRKAVDAVGKQEFLLEEIGSIAKIGGWEYDPFGGNHRWTRELFKIHGMKSGPESEIINRYQDYTPKSRKLFEKAMRRSLRSGHEFSLECELITQEGRHKWVRVIGKPVFSDGRVIKMQGTVQDISEMKKAAREILESREYLGATLDSIGDAVIVTDLNGIITRLNPAAAKITGWISEDATGRPFETVFRIIKENTGQDINPVEGIIWGNNGAGLPENLILVSKEGIEIPVMAKGTPLKDRLGETTGVVLVFGDRSKEWLLRKIQDLRIRLFEYSATHTLNELLVKIIDELEELTGSSIGFYHFFSTGQDQVKLQAWSTRTRRQYCSLTADNRHYDISEAGIWAESLKTGKPVIHNDFRSLAYRKGFSEGHAEVFRLLTVPVVRNNRVVAIIGLGNKPVDFTRRDTELLSYIADRTWEVVEKMRSDEEFRVMEKKLRLLNRSVDQSTISLFITDTEGEIEHVNRTFLERSGYTYEELCGKMLRILKPGNAPESMQAEIWENLNAGGEWQGEWQNRRKSGEVYWERVYLSAVKNNQDRVENFIALCEDITQQKKIESDLIAAKEKAEESDRLKSAFLANMSHEIRTPMNGILGFLQLINKPDISDIARDQYISIINESGNRLMDTINDLIEISQIETGQLKISFSAIDLNEILEYLYGFFKPEAENKGLQLIACNNLPVPGSIIYTDKSKLQSILVNLIKNALKFTREGFVEFGAGIKDNSLCLYVKDSGIGIPGDKLEKIFDRFVQADMTYSKAYEGSGLGLSLVRSYIDALGGTISVKSQVGQGTVFKITLAYTLAENGYDLSA